MNLVSNCVLSRIPTCLFIIFSLGLSSSISAADSPLTAVVSNATDISLAADGSLSNQKMWESIVDKIEVNSGLSAKLAASPLIVRLLELDEISFKSSLNENNSPKPYQNPNRNSPTSRTLNNSAAKTTNSISLPLPDGNQVNVNITPNTVMSDALALQFPDIKTWRVTGVSENITGVVDFTHHGFRGMLLMPDGDRVFIQPDIEEGVSPLRELSAQGRYISFSKKQNKGSFQSEFSCGVHDDSTLTLNLAAKDNSNSDRLSARSAPDLITYRLAVAATGEYTQASGGSTSSALSNIVTTISRVNELYARDLGIVFQLVDEQKDIIYLNPNTDPYTNSNVFMLIEENNENLSINGVLSKDKYDVGHVFGAGNVGGLAVVGGVCLDDEKAYGATGIFNPFGDAFALDYVAHELGHQLGGTHTFNSACGDGSERSPSTAVEPGSGTTIMAYPGICQSNNLQTSVDPQFHAVSIFQIRETTRESNGSNCGVFNVSTNENPTVNAGADSIVPARTPLAFIGDGADADNDDLTYVWEQADAGTVSNVNVDTGNNALFRSRPLTSDNVRFIPTLNDLFSGTTTLGEVLPVTNRDINMVATVRDGNGGLQTDLVKLQVFDTGESFRVTSQTNAQTFSRQDIADVRWNVAGTNSSPISCSNVDIGLATANGQGIDIITTANDGSAEVIIPSTAPAMNNARFIISCSNSNFFNVSAGRLTILNLDGGSGGGDGEGDEEGSGGGGSFGFFILFWGSLLIFIRRMQLVIR